MKSNLTRTLHTNATWQHRDEVGQSSPDGLLDLFEYECLMVRLEVRRETGDEHNYCDILCGSTHSSAIGQSMDSHAHLVHRKASIISSRYLK